MRLPRWFYEVATAVVVSIAAITVTTAQTYPNRTVRIVVPFGAGSLTDLLARMIAEDGSKKWGQQVLVENRPGLPGTISVSRAEPDGLTLMLTSNGHAAIGYINKNLDFDPVKDFAGITRVATIPMYLIVHPSVPAKSISELIGYAKSKPSTLNFASPGLGSGGFIAAALFKKLAGVDIVHVPYKGHPEAMTAMMRGDAQIYFTPLNATDELVQTGKVRAIASLAGRRTPELPEVPTFKESGFDLAHSPWYGLMAPRRVPKEIVAKINKDVLEIVQSARFKERLQAQFLIGLADGPDQFDEIIRDDTAALRDVFKDFVN